MAFQSSVATQMGFGVAGDLFSEGPTRSRSFTLDSPSAANNVMGRVFTIVSEGVARAGGTGVLAGIMVGPKEQATSGTSGGGTLAPTLTLRNAEIAEMLTMGEVIIAVPGACDIGDLLVYNTTTGLIDTIAPDASPFEPPAGYAFVPNAVIWAYAPTGAGLAVAKITN